MIDASADGSGDTPPGTPPRKVGGWRLAGRWLAGLFIAGSFVFWAWAFSPWARSENPARIDDRDFAAWADQRCAQAQEVIDALPSARQAASRAQRADHIDLGSNAVASLVTDLRRRAEVSLTAVTDSEGPADTELVGDWLADWDVYVADRRNHVVKLRTASEDTPDRELRFLLLDMTEGSTYTERMNGFARLNEMDNCQVPGDV
ncbi:MAG: hypothetical protein OXE79_10020 [Acidimicrobiaceae bacterium]|nr:hypothetical protein [Acidimicrobiaceae bacterium]MCY4279252.1 hypothetical protein [Acidimicrobiaceae bacterium]MCY4293228.1 hypothetical protein [Acidimicrobiaceae bacterium]